jgi:hypothetical protein
MTTQKISSRHFLLSRWLHDVQLQVTTAAGD